MNGSGHSKNRKRQVSRVVGASAAILVVAGVMGIPFNIMAAMLLGAALVTIVIP